MDGMEARSVARGGSGKDGMGWQMLQGLENVSGRVRACSGVLVPALPPLPEWFVIYITTWCGRLCHACTLCVCMYMVSPLDHLVVHVCAINCFYRRCPLPVAPALSDIVG